MSNGAQSRSPKEFDRVNAPEHPVEQCLPTEKINGSPGTSSSLAGRTQCSDDLSSSTSGDGQPLNKRRASILAFVRDFRARYHYPPTVREIVLGCSLSTNSLAAHHLRGLEEKGYLTRIPEIARGIVLAELERSGPQPEPRD